MELKEIKKLVHFARKAGVKSMSFNGLAVEFKDEIIIQHPRKPRLATKDGKATAASPEKAIPAPAPLPTLDEINQYIYGQSEEVG